MNIKEKFIELTYKTYPHGTEEELFPLLNGLHKDDFGNLFIKIGESDVMFTSHLDTATLSKTNVVHVIEGDIIKTDGFSILGADDKAGVTIMLYMIENKIPGLYYFFVGEEVGCIGSKKVAEHFKVNKIDSIKKVISFDRCDYNSVITFQRSSRCCSDKFAEALANQLNANDPSFNYKPDSSGVSTDSRQFAELYPECTNISVGYNLEHTHYETQDIAFLEKLANACLKVDWANLPIERDPSKVEYIYNTKRHNYIDEYDDYYGSSSQYWKSINDKLRENEVDKIWFHDTKYNYVSKIEMDSLTKKIISVELSEYRIQEERELIYSLLRNLELNFSRLSWDGFKLNIFYDSSDCVNKCDRNDLIEYLPELDFINFKIDDMNAIRYLENKTLANEGSQFYTGYCDDIF
jgi:hypothetical protein